MLQVTLHGESCNLSGELPAIGSSAPDFTLVAADLTTQTLKDYVGKLIILNIFPSIDTDVCATSVRKFNKEASSLDNTAVLCISRDLPFAQGRFCGAEGLENVTTLSDFRSGDFGKTYGLAITDGALAGLLARAVIIIDKSGNIIYSELVPEIAQEPDYAAALAAL